MTMTTQELMTSLAERGIDNPESVVSAHDAEVIERSMIFWDRKRRTTSVGPGLLVQVIRRGGPTVEAVAEPEPADRTDWYGWVREHFADVLETWPYAIHMLAARASLLSIGRWDVTPELVRTWWDHSAWSDGLKECEA